MNIEHIGPRLKRFREEAKRSQEQLAELAGIPQGTISRIENAVHGDVEVATISALARALGLTTSELIGEVEPQADPKIRQISVLMEPMSDWQKNSLIGAAKGILEADRKAG